MRRTDPSSPFRVSGAERAWTFDGGTIRLPVGCERKPSAPELGLRDAGRRGGCLGPRDAGTPEGYRHSARWLYVREDEMARDAAARRAEERITDGEYGPGALDEATVPRTDERRVLQESDVDDPAHVPIDPEVLRDGGPTRGQGAVTTTGGTAGPASVRRLPRSPEKHPGRVAPTTTGDATTGGLSTPAGGSTSDQSSQASQVGNFTDH